MKITLKSAMQNALLVLASLLVLLLVLEVGARIYTGNYAFKNVLEDHLRITMARYPTRYDETLGWVSREGVSEADRWVERITILEGGIRSNGKESLRLSLQRENPILAVGDSFTFGYEVGDEETWPAILENLTGRPVLNGGVIAYGMDQSLLRARKLVEKYQPDTLIYSFIPNDIWRNQISARSGVNKPYFEIRDGALVLENSPVPRPALTDFGNPGIRKYLGYSVFLHHFMMRYGPAMWWVRGTQWKDRQVHDDDTGEAIACLIIRELDAMAREKDIDVYLLAQYGRNIKSPSVLRSGRVIECAAPRDLVVVDLYRPMLEMRSRDRQQFRSLFTPGKRHHMTYAGNRFVAQQLKAAMDARKPGDKTASPPDAESGQ